ncbi:MAG: serine protease [Thermoguttaceae bacterium]|jgi:hypothetical protein
MTSTRRSTVTATVLLATLLAANGASQAAISDCIDATCRITLADGSCGSGCVFEIDQGHVYVLTAAHVVAEDATARCEFWRYGHQSQPVAGRVITRSEEADAAVIDVPAASLGGMLPAVIPLAPRDFVVRPAATLTSVGCANGTWSTAWKGHALGYEGNELRFLPVPANGRSGSAVFDAEGRQIVGLLRARTGDNSEGIATSVQAIYRAFDAARTGGTAIAAIAPARNAEVPLQCPGGVCPLLPRNRQQQPSPQPWPTLPPTETAPARPMIDISPLDDKLGRIAAMLEEMRKPRESAPPSASLQPLVDEPARKAAETALGQVAELRAESERSVREMKSDVAKANEAVGGLTNVVEKIKDSIGENGTVSQRFHARVDKVKSELEERLGHEASDREVRIAYVKDLIQDKFSDGGMFKILAIAAGMVLVLWLVIRDVKQHRETGDPLAIEKLASLIEGKVSALHDRLDVLKERLPATPPAAPAAPPPATPK